MDLIETVTNISGWGWAGIAVVILSIIQIAPIKLDPWSWLLRRIGKVVNQEVIERQEAFQKESVEYRRNNDLQIKNLAALVDRKGIEDCRNRILRFGDEIKSKQKHSEEYYNQILADISEYEEYCRTHPKFKNERTIATEKIIRSKYEEHVLNNDFL